MATVGHPDKEDSPPPDVPGLAQRRKSAQTLTPLLLRRDASVDVCTAEEVQQAQVAGVAVYTEFLEQRLQTEGIPDDELAMVIKTLESLRQTATSSITQSGSETETRSANLFEWREKGKRLHKIAVKFEQSEERKRVQHEAQRVETDIDKEQFLELMEGFFQDNRVTSHRIVVLFTFCSDVIVMAVKKYAKQLFAKILGWAIEYITDKVCAWVARHGGWDAVLGQHWTYVSTAVKFIAAGFCIYVGYKIAKYGLESIRKK